MENTTNRKNFRCIFNPYVTKDNRDGVIRSVISQFQGYDADPEVTLTDDGFIITVTLSGNLSATQVRDKILWNQFIERVSAQDAIRKIQIIRIPKNQATKFIGDPFSDPEELDDFSQGRDYPRLDGEGQMSYTIGDKTQSVHYADPTGNIIPEVIAGGGEVVDTDLKDPTVDKDVEPVGHRNLSRLFNAFRRVSFDSGTGGTFTLDQPNRFQQVDTPTTEGGEEAPAATGIGGGAPISGASFFVYDPSNAQGTDVGKVRNLDNASAAPFGNISANKIHQDDPVEDVDSALEIPAARGGVGQIPGVEHWFLGFKEGDYNNIDIYDDYV